MARERGELVPIGEVIVDLPGPSLAAFASAKVIVSSSINPI